MKKAMVILGALMVFAVAALPAMASGGWGMMQSGNGNNCPGTVCNGETTTVTGVVLEDRTAGNMAEIETGDGTKYYLGLGPVKSSSVELKKGDKVEVSGCLVAGTNRIIVLSISVNGDKEIVLRNGNGMMSGNGQGNGCMGNSNNQAGSCCGNTGN